MALRLIKDRDWAMVAERSCEVVNFTPYATVRDDAVAAPNVPLPYAIVDLVSRERGLELPSDTVGHICHREDFKLLWKAFVERGVKPDEKVLIYWSKRNIKFPANLLAAFLPRLAVTIFKSDSWELLTNSAYRPDLRGEARLEAELPTHHWQPEVWKDPIVSTLYEHYVGRYANTGDERYLPLILDYR